MYGSAKYVLITAIVFAVSIILKEGGHGIWIVIALIAVIWILLSGRRR